MIRSMTGFGRYEVCNESHKIVVEMKSVNHKFCDVSIRMPKKFNFFEVGIRNVLKEYVSRGKIEVFISFEDYTKNKMTVKYNSDIANGYMERLGDIAEEFGLPMDVSLSTLSRYQDVLVLEEQSVDEDALFKSLEEAVREAAKCFVETRTKEGETLKRDLMKKLDSLYDTLQYIVERSPEILKEYREKITLKVRELLGNFKLDESALATELVIYADKVCTDEETVRLKSHILNMKNVLNETDSVGRKLDFIAQEMNREANTILSKSNDIEVSNRAIDIKTEIEKIREQIQNIE